MSLFFLCNSMTSMMTPQAVCRTTPIAVISNCNSGHNRDQRRRVDELVSRCPGLLHYRTSSAAEIPAILENIARQSVEVLAINGGDGTAAHIFAHLLQDSPFKTPPLIALLPGGTANMTAGDVGVKGSLLRALERLCHWSQGERLIAGRVVQRHVLRVEVGAGRAPHFGMFFGSGAIIQASEYAHREIHSRGLRDDFSLGLGLVRTLWGIVRGHPEFNQPLPVDVTLDGERYGEFHARILAISSLERLFLGIHPFWGSGEAPLKMSLITSDAKRFLRTFLSILRRNRKAQPTTADGYHSHRAEQITLLMDGSFNLDGEIVPVRREDGPVVITAAEPLSFLAL